MNAKPLHVRNCLWQRLPVILIIVVGSVLNVASMPSVYAASMTVTTTDDEMNTDGDCSLREAVQAANTDRAVDACPTGNGADAITIPAGSYAGPIVITSDVTITGAGSELTLIDGRGRARGVEVLVGITTIAGLTIQHGASYDDGSGIYNAGTLTLNNVRLHENYGVIIFWSNGGAIFNGGTLTISRSIVSRNSAIDGGGIYNTGSLTITDTTFDANTAEHIPELWGSGGAIANHGTATIKRSILRGNRSATTGGGIANSGTLAISDSTFDANEALRQGGGISTAGVLTVTNSTFSRNKALFGDYYEPFPEAFGGAITGSGTVVIQNSTITDNAAKSGGGGIAGMATMSNSIVAGNTTLDGQPADCSGSLISQGYNLIQNTTGCTIEGDTSGNQYGVNPRLGPLQDNGGPTPTHALLVSSPAIDAGNPAIPGSGGTACEPTDQRSMIRPQDGNGDGLTRCDSGAYEVQDAALRGKVTGGGTIAGQTGGTATFEFVVQRKTAHGAISGKLDYHDPHAHVHVSNVQFQSLAMVGDTATFGGTATVNGRADVQFSVTARDAGEGRGSRDTFSVRLDTGYTNQRLVTGGNIQIHR